MIKNAKSLKDQAKNIAKENNISIQQVLQNYMFERILERLSKSKYKENFIIKGGLLLSSIMGINLRTTMDIDTNVTGIDLEKEELLKILNEILNVDIGDNVSLSKAIIRTFSARNSITELRNIKETIRILENNPFLNRLWLDYSQKHEYSKNISFNDTIKAIEVIEETIFSNNEIKLSVAQN